MAIGFPPRALIGTRLALAGAVLYLLEWAVIPFLPGVPTDRLGDDAQAIVEAYADDPGLVAFAAGWFGVVLLGRVLYAVALRDALEASGRPSTLARFAVSAMAVSVAIEVAAFAVVAAAAWLADNGADSAAIVALDAVPTVGPLFGAIGVSVLAASLAMLASGLFRNWLCWLGIVSGSFTIVGGIIEPARAGANGTFYDLGQIPLAIGVPTFWIWMLATSIILWRNAPKRADNRAAA